MKSICLLLGLAALVTTVVEPAAAGTKEGDRFRFSLTAGASATDNRDAAPDGLEADNTDLYLRPRIDMYLDGERMTLDLFYTPSLRYRTDPGLNQDDLELLHELGIDALLRATPRLKLRAGETFSFTDASEEPEDTSTVRASRTFVANRAHVGFDGLVSRRTVLGATVRHYLKRYDDEDVADVSDEDRLDVSGHIRRQFTHTVFAGVMGRYAMFGYAETDGIMRDFDTVTAALTLEKAFSRNLRAGVNGGAQFTSYDDDGIDGSTSPFGEVWVQGETTPAFRMRGVVGHAVRDADAYPFASQEYTEVRGNVAWDMSSSITLSLGGGYRDSQYEDVLPSAAPLASLIGLPDGDETRVYLVGQAALNLTRNTTVRLKHLYEDVDSDVSTSYDRSTTTLELTQAF